MRRLLKSALALAAVGLQAPEEWIDVRGVRLPAVSVVRPLVAAAESAPLPVGEPWPEWSDRGAQGFGGERAWRRWVELVRAEQRSGDPRRRAELTVLARLQGRDADAWRHLAACAAEPGLVATLLPLFSPGVPPSELGRAGPLPEGVLLRPALPPSEDARGALRFLAGRRIECADVRVASARLTLAVAVDRDGIEVMLLPSEGTARVRILAPLPRGVDAGLVFADWEKLPGHQGPVEFALDPTAGEHSLWLTFHPPASRWPEPAVEALAPLAPGRAIVLVTPHGNEPHLARFAEALAELTGARTRLVTEAGTAPGEMEPLVLRLDDPASAERKLVDLVGLTEAFALRSALR
jgi:hypothetical protein